MQIPLKQSLETPLKNFQLKHEVSFQKEERDSERLAGDEAVLKERDIGKKTLLLDRKFQPNQ